MIPKKPLRGRARAPVTCSLAAAVSLTLTLASCSGTTGSDLVSFRAAAAGPVDAVAGQPLVFTSGRGFRVTLTQATMHVGAVYLNRSLPTSGAQATSCVLPGIYVGEIRTGLDVDVLSPLPQPFAALGDGTADRALAGEVWLTGGDVNAAEDSTVIVRVAGSAEGPTGTFPFTGVVTIGSNHAIGSPDPAQPGLNPPCKERIVSPIPADVTPSKSGSLLLRIDPRGWFANVDFSALVSNGATPPVYEFDDSGASQPSYNLFKGLHAADGVYSFSWSAK